MTKPKPLTVWITTNYGKFLKRWKYQNLRNLYAGQEATARTGHRIKTGSKLGKEYVKAICCHSAYLTSMQSTEYIIWNSRLKEAQAEIKIA